MACYDHVVSACHSDQALRLLDAVLDPAQRAVLSAIRYQPNRAVLHTDSALLPRRRRLWSAWNYFARRSDDGDQPVGVSYLINRLQPLPFASPVMVTLNPAREPDPAKVLDEFDYAHPVFDAAAIAAPPLPITATCSACSPPTCFVSPPSQPSALSSRPAGLFGVSVSRAR